MKFIISALLAFVSADRANMDRQFEALANATGDKDRVFSGAIANSISNLNEVGCWCYFDEDIGRGKGKPFDDLDGLCQALGKGYDCAMRDAEEVGDTCVPYEVDYNPGTATGGNTLFESCQELNGGDNCASRACAVEGAFVENLLAYLLGGGSIPDSSKHANGFDVVANCPTNPGPPGEKACCGIYPDRKAFKTLDGDRACCGTRTFNTLTSNCCNEATSLVKFNC